jgi:hypothetical protein
LYFIHQDTRGIWDELQVRDGQLTDFRNINKCGLEAALAKVELQP